MKQLNRNLGGPAAAHHPANHTPVLLFQFDKPWEGGLQAHLFCVSRIDTGHQGLDHPLERLPTNSPLEEAGQGLIFR